jgi:hypothetical protein
MSKLRYADGRLARMQDIVARAMYEWTPQSASKVWEHDSNNPDVPVVSEATRLYWLGLARAAMEAMKRHLEEIS